MAPTRIYIKSVLPLTKAGLLIGLRPHHRRRPDREPAPRHRRGPGRRASTGTPGRRRRCSTGCSETGGVDEAEMRRTFNCGVGLLLIVAPARRRGRADRPAERGRVGIRVRRTCRRLRTGAEPFSPKDNTPALGTRSRPEGSLLRCARQASGMTATRQRRIGKERHAHSITAVRHSGSGGRRRP